MRPWFSTNPGRSIKATAAALDGADAQNRPVLYQLFQMPLGLLPYLGLEKHLAPRLLAAFDEVRRRFNNAP